MVFSVFYGFFGFWGEPDGNLGPLAPGEYQPLWPPGPDEGSTTGCLWWGLTGGEVRNMRHISRVGMSHDGGPSPMYWVIWTVFRISRIFQVFQVQHGVPVLLEVSARRFFRFLGV